MRKLLVLLSLVAVSAFAEPSFQQVESLIEQKNFQSAEMALEQIISAHPNSAKAFYAMSQAQAGLGNLEKAQFALIINLAPWTYVGKLPISPLGKISDTKSLDIFATYQMSVSSALRLIKDLLSTKNLKSDAQTLVLTDQH